MDNIISICTLLLSCYLIACILKPANLIETILFFFCLSSGIIIIWSYIASSASKLGDLGFWSMTGMTTLLIAGVFFLFLKSKFLALHLQIHASAKSIAQWYSTEVAANDRLLLFPMLIAALFSSLFNLAIIFFTAPHNWDSMTYHLARMAYYLQQNNFSFFSANYWAQVVHPKNSTSLLIYTFLITAHNENLTQLIQYAAYLIFVLCIFGISQKTGFTKTQSVFSALVGSLLIESILQATTTQNDLIIAAYLGITTYCFLAFKKEKNWAYLLISGLGIALALGSKASTLMAMPSIGIIALYVLFSKTIKKDYLRNLALFTVFVFISILCLSLPAGYIDNYTRFNHPIGPLEVRQIHSFESESLRNILKSGIYNTLRYGLDFISLDGLPPTDFIDKAQKLIRLLPEKILLTSGTDLESNIAINFTPFHYVRTPALNEERAYWGILGFGLIWIITLLSLSRPVKNKNAFVLSIASIIFFLAQSFTGPYDASRGRYFIICALFATPTVGLWLETKNKLVRIYLMIILSIGSISAVSASYLKTSYHSSNYSNTVNDKSLFAMDRNQQLVFNNPRYYAPLSAFDFLVPQDATVAIYFFPNTFEYPLFGQYLTRTIIPINTFNKGLLAIPENADFLLYSKGYPCPRPRDKYLGADWFLRELNKNNRECQIQYTH